MAGLRAFGVTARAVTYAPVGFGDYHWAVDGGDARWFATVADLAHKPHGDTGPLDALRRAMDTAAALAAPFVVAPLRATGGTTVVPLDERYALSVFPYVDGEAGEFGQRLTDDGHDRVLELLADLHRAAPPATTPVAEVSFPGRRDLDAVLREPDEPWTGGPCSAPARDLLASRAEVVRARLAEFDRLAEEVRRDGGPVVVTHGEPHPGNLVLTERGPRLVDWDTVGLAVPERDLAVLPEDRSTRRYAELTGHVPRAAALALYRLRWSLLDVAEFVAWFRAPHSASPDTETAWRGFVETLDHLAG
ncbi:spectinomycin phosphotransferase [Saccharothrix australiensis]|uniref:Spectinomycin phosphotransferase n=1 Tax=Saccharothrix australiensis TaxID=2072 RepID=A0A495W2G9_9PSEU|nr:spectinomycin phosphotransferase [Saccharothrix australiensis]